MYHCGVNILVIFPCGFADRIDIIIPRQRTLPQPIAFGFVVPNATLKITCACAHPKSVTSSEHFSSFEIIRAYDQYYVGRIWVIPLSRILVCQKIKICLKYCECI